MTHIELCHVCLSDVILTHSGPRRTVLWYTTHVNRHRGGVAVKFSAYGIKSDSSLQSASVIDREWEITQTGLRPLSLSNTESYCLRSKPCEEVFELLYRVQITYYLLYLLLFASARWGCSVTFPNTKSKNIYVCPLHTSMKPWLAVAIRNAHGTVDT